MNILFTICGRAGSKGFKNKNLKTLNGVPLIFYSFAVIKEYIDTHKEDDYIIVVNTDSKELLDISNSQAILQVNTISRRNELAGDRVAKVDVIRDTYLKYQDFNPNVVVDLDITSPVRRLVDLENVISEFERGIYDLVFSVVEARRNPYFNMVKKNSDRYYNKVCDSTFTARQQAPEVYDMNASIYAYNPGFLVSEIKGTILDYKCGISVMPDYLVLDIDSENDFEMMGILHKYYCEKDNDLMTIYNIAQLFV